MSQRQELFSIDDEKYIELAKALGTPLQVYDEEFIEHQFRSAMENFSSPLFETQVVYASKAFSCTAIFKKLMDFGLYADVVSGGELYGAALADFPMERIYFHGNNKSPGELRYALEEGVGTIVLDNPHELQDLISAAEEVKKSIEFLIRINPGIEAHTHKYIMTAHRDSKFGIAGEDHRAIHEIYRLSKTCSYTKFSGFHMHIGSQITDPTSFEQAISIMGDFVKTMYEDYEIYAETVSLGGGFGIKYNAGDKASPLGEMCRIMIEKCESVFGGKPFRPKTLTIEPGRSLVGEAGVTLYTVGLQKDTENKHYLFVDGGMSDNIRPSLYDALYTCDILGKRREEKTVKTCIAGKNCESGDILIEEAMLPPAETGEILIVYSTGAYGYSMASNYNKLGRPAVVFLKGDEARLVLRREEYDDMYQLDIDERIKL